MHRREFLHQSALLAATLTLGRGQLFAAANSGSPLEQFSYSDVTLESDLFIRQLENTHSVLMSLDEDALLQPFRMMSGKPSTGLGLGGWYAYNPDYDYRTTSIGFCPGGTFGQWISALARFYAITGDTSTREKVLRLNRLYAESVGPGYFDQNRFPAYCYDKLVCGLIDSHQFANDPDALTILQRTTDTALPYLPPHAIPHDQHWRAGKEGDISWDWDESYTLPENLFLAYQRGAGDRYKPLAIRFLDDSNYFDPLAANINVLPGKHAYSYVNALSSAIQAYLTLGSEKHLRAAKNAFQMLVTTQSFATGGWGPDEQFRLPNTGALAASLVDQHKSFETPCGAYAHSKLSRYLLRITRNSSYGDSLERVLYNTVLGAKPLQSDGTSYYYSDYTYHGRKGYSNHIWPCCAGTLPQIAADYCLCAYFHSDVDLYINLYVPSTLRWNRGVNQIQLKQLSNYPFEELVRFEITATHPDNFNVWFRVPAWTSGASIKASGNVSMSDLRPGGFVPIRRQWKSGDRIELHLPMTTRLEPVDAQHPNIVALMYGPLVLFPITEQPPSLTRQQLLAAKRSGAKSWQVQSTGGQITLIPFTEISDESYTTYVRLA